MFPQRFRLTIFLTFVFMVFTASQIAGILEGEVQENQEIAVHKLAKIEEGEEGSLNFLANPKYTPHISTTKASVTLVNKDFSPGQNLATTLIKVEDAYESFSKLLEYYNQVENTKTGSTKIGKSCMIGGQVGIVGHITISDNIRIQTQSGIGRNIENNEILQGSPGLNYSDYNKSYVHFKNLPKIVNQINKLEKKIDSDNN